MLRNKSFWALFFTQFFGAFNDNFFRTALVTLITYHLTTYTETTKSLFVSAAFGLFMLPFFVFSPLAGQVSDRFDKAFVIRIIKASEIIIVSLSAYGFIQKDPYFLLLTLFFMGTHSAFFGPTKYGILPDILPNETLLRGNGYIEAGTFLAIMLGTLTGALMIHLQVSLYLISLQLVFVSILGFLASFQIKRGLCDAPLLKIRFSWVSEMKALYGYAHKDERVLKSIVCISWFWLVGAVLLAQLPILAKDVLNLTESVFIFLLLLFTIGIGSGSILCNWLFKGEITIKRVPLFALLMIPFLFDIASFRAALDVNPVTLFSFLTTFQGLELTFDFLALSFVGGLFIVPLYAFIQIHIPANKRSQVISFNNIINAGFMVFSSFSSFCLLAIGVTVPALIFITALGQVILTIYTMTGKTKPAFQ